MVWTLPAMVMFKWVATEKLKLLWFMFLMANTIRVFPANPDRKCGMDVYQRVILTFDLHVLTALAATVLLLAVRMALNAAESNAVTASNAVAATRAIYAGAKAYDAYHEAKAAAAAVEGVGSIAAKWRRVSLRGMLLLAVVLSAAASLLAVVALEDGYAYWIGCDAGYGAGSPLGVFVMVLMVLVHGSSAWTAVSEN